MVAMALKGHSYLYITIWNKIKTFVTMIIDYSQTYYAL